MTMETLVEAMARLETAGYRGAFSATPDGLRCPSCGGSHDPGDVGIDELVRFEGESDPGDEVIMFALRCGGCGATGTYVVAYGPMIEPDDAEVVSRLVDRRR